MSRDTILDQKYVFHNRPVGASIEFPIESFLDKRFAPLTTVVMEKLLLPSNDSHTACLLSEQETEESKLQSAYQLCCDPLRGQANLLSPRIPKLVKSIRPSTRGYTLEL